MEPNFLIGREKLYWTATQFSGLFSLSSETKSSLVERFIRSLKTRSFEYFHTMNDKRYIEILPQFVNAYYSSVYRIIGLKPKDVNIHNEEGLWNRQYGNEFPRSSEFRFNVNYTVRMSELKNVFENFQFAHRRASKPVTYKLKLKRNVPKAAYMKWKRSPL